MSAIKKKRLLLVGAHNLARELFSWMKPGTGSLAGYEFGGFLSDQPRDLASYPCYSPGIVGTIVDFVPRPADVLVMAIADPRGKLAVAELLERRGCDFLTFVHPTVLLSDYVTLGRGVVICPHSVVSCHVVIGDFATINLGCTIGHDVKLGRGSTLSAQVDLTGFVEVADGAFFGSHASVLPGAKVGAFARVGAGTVVLRRVKPGATVMGVPAQQITP